jgi:hypothetical protein
MRNAGRCIRYEPRHAEECCHPLTRGAPPRSRGGDPVSGTARPQAETAHLPALRRGTRGGEPTSPLSSRRASWDAAQRRALAVSARPCPATFVAGRS